MNELQDNKDDFPLMMRPGNKYAGYFCEMLELYLENDGCEHEDFANAEILLDEMKFDVDYSLAYFETAGAVCDCEILPIVFGI